MSSFTEQKGIGFRKLVWESLPEMWGYQMTVGLILAIPATFFLRLMNGLAQAGDGALTSANLRSALSWRLPLILLLGLALVFFYVVIEIFSHIHFADDILNGRSRSMRERLLAGMKSVSQMASLGGVAVLLFILIAVPLCGIGFSIRLSSSFQIPNFIMDVVIATPMYLAMYLVILSVFLWIAYTSMFILHAMVIDKLSVKQARAKSKAMVKKHGKSMLWELLKLIVCIGIVLLICDILFVILPEMWLEDLATNLPKNYHFDIFSKSSVSEISDLEWSVVGFRFLCVLVVVMGTYLVFVASLLCGSFFMLRFTYLYYRFTDREQKTFSERPKKSGYFLRIASIFAVLCITVFGSGLIGLFYHQIFDREKKVEIIAHRAGGFAATENSLEGLLIAIENRVYGSEIDVQKTKDKKYIINHDATFKRLAGVDKAAKDMTYSEIEKLEIRDANSKDGVSGVPTLEEMLLASKSKIKLFVELKGAGIDEEMADDIVGMIRAHRADADVAIISLDYKIIDYVERTYPELDTGVLFFAGLGDVTKLNCDMLIMEEMLAFAGQIEAIQNAGKKAIVWTVNTEESMRKFLDSAVDAVITDDMFLAKRIQTELDNRSDLEVIRDTFQDIWEY